jgi:hypothetical protein
MPNALERRRFRPLLSSALVLNRSSERIRRLAKSMMRGVLPADRYICQALEECWWRARISSYVQYLFRSRYFARLRFLSTFNAADVVTWQGRSLLAVHFHGFERVVMEAINLSLGVLGLRNSLIQNGLSSRARISNSSERNEEYSADISVIGVQWAE